jgi:SAM-dependent methyltransferase
MRASTSEIMPKKPPKVEARPRVLREAMMQRVHRRLVANGSLLLPAAPGLTDAYVEKLLTIFGALGRTFSTEQTEHLGKVVAEKLHEAFEKSPYSRIYVEYFTDPSPAVAVSYVVSVRHSTMEMEYEEWTRDRTPPLFGKHPDAKVMALAASLGAPGDVPVLDMGAGTGRNALPLARAGHPTSAVEASPALCDILRDTVEKEGVPAVVVAGDFMDESLPLAKSHFKLIVLSEVVYHLRELHRVRTLFRRCGELLAQGGLLCVSVFASDDAYTPDRLTRELAEVFWSTVQTRAELRTVTLGLPLSLVSDESVFEYEKEHLPKEAWPPTGWFTEWTLGQDVFDLPEPTAPLGLRWLVYRKS